MHYHYCCGNDYLYVFLFFSNVKPIKYCLKKKKKCVQCGLTLNRCNLRVHNKRKHSGKKDITAEHHLSCQCIDPQNGIFAVKKTFTGPSNPIHVIKKTSGTNLQVRCEMVLCKANAEFAERSNYLAFECDHLRSLTYCLPGSDTIALEENILNQMVQEKWFSEAKKQTCQQLQTEANNKGVPLSCLVDIGGPRSKIFISVYEPHLSYYSRLGRVMVSYDSNKVEWCCPCAKQRQTCTHKCIAKWHLFQINPDLFKNIPDIDVEANESRENATEDVEQLRQEQAQYPPEDPVLTKMVRYIFRKKIPADLPPDLRKSKSDFPQHLIPTECTGLPQLGKPQLITSQARIVTVTEIIEGFILLFLVFHKPLHI